MKGVTAKEVVAIDSLTYGGSGVGKWPDGRICFVHGTVPGDVAEVEPRVIKSRFIQGKAVPKLISKSANRIKAGCHCYPDCPGCNYLAIPYHEELRWKNRQLADFLVRGNWVKEDDIASPFPAPSRFGLRNKIKLASQDGQWGYRAWDNISLVPVIGCPLARPEINQAIGTALPPKSGTTTWRFTQNDGTVVNGGKRLLTETLGDFGDFKVPFDSFFQTNLPVAAELALRVKKLVAELEVNELLELYCGVGVFSLIIAMAGSIRCRGIEIDPQAIAAAKLNAKLRKVDKRCSFLAADANQAIDSIKDLTGMAVIIDPPRIGVEEKVIKRLTAARPKGVIYISCAADTLCRDAGRFAAGGYHLAAVQLLDMFPGTAHFEILTLFKPF